MVNIVVCIKAVPQDLNVPVSRRTGEVVLEGARFVINPWEKRAIECALRLKEESGGTVTVVTMDEPSSEVALREALAMGVDKAVLAWDPSFDGADTLATARVLGKLVEKTRADLVITGGRAADRRAATVGPALAQITDIPAVTFIRDATLDGRTLRVKKRFGAKIGTFEVPLPALVSVGDEYPKPRVATAWGVYDAYRDGEITTWNARDLGIDEESTGRAGSPTRVRRLEKLKAERRDKVECEFFEGEPEDVAKDFVRRLRARGVVR